MNRKKKIGISIPVANEENNIKEFITALMSQIKTLKVPLIFYFVIDNVSKDNTKTIIKQYSKKYSFIKLIYEPQNKNVVDAYIRGFKEAIKDNCDFIIDMDCGFSHLPQELGLFIQGFNEGYDCVFGIRPLTSSDYKVPLKRRVVSFGGTILSNLLLGMHYKDTTSGYVGYTRRTLRSLLKTPLMSKGHFWHTEMRFRARKLKFKEVHISYSFPSPRLRISSIINSFSTLFYLMAQVWKEKLFSNRHVFLSEK